MLEPHGGALVSRIIPEREKGIILGESHFYPSLEADEEILMDVENIATGVFSPLKGFMTEEELLSVARTMQLPDGTLWTIPILFQLREKPNIPGEGRVLLKDEKGDFRAVLDVKEVFRIDLKRIAGLVWGTESDGHPGVRHFYSKGEWAVGGEVWLLKESEIPFRNWVLKPEDVRKIFEYRGWKTVVAFQTRNAPHRAHEYLHRLGLEIGDGLFINPILGWKKSDDFDSETILRAYDLLINNYYPKGRVLLSGLATSMRYAGPREAVFHAIIRKNFGCTHFIVGRDHAGVGNFYDPYGAHRIFDSLPGDIGIEIIKVSEVFYCSLCECMATVRSCGHPEENRIYVSMTRIREMIRRGRIPPGYILRPDVAEFLIQKYGKSPALRAAVHEEL